MAHQPKAKARTVEEVVGFAYSHRIRIEAQTIFNERVASTQEVAEELGEDLNKVGNHVRALRRTGRIELVRSEPRGGSIEHFYRAVQRPEIDDEEWQALSEEGRREIFALVFGNLIAEGFASLRTGKMDHDDDLCLVWRAANLDAQGRSEAAEAQRAFIDELLHIEARAASRMAQTGERGISTVLAVLGFLRSRNGRPHGELPG